ncbi:MAG TPA: hypothetical protein VF533_20450 [Solirubrobacteraceae bacterium]|jgi:hypothetical protein
MRILARAVPALAALAGLAIAAAPPAAADQQGPDYVTSDNVEYLTSFKPATGLTAGARIIGKYLYVTSAKDLEIFDISKPETPQLVGNITANIQFENEEVPTNGKLLGISSDLVNTGAECLTSPPSGVNTVVGGGCLRLYDVRKPDAVKELPSVIGAGDHTSTCVLDCSYFYGSRGTITDARAALEPGGKAVKLKENWKEALRKQGFKFAAEDGAEVSCHNVNEVRPGILITACQPFTVLSVLPEDGGSITNPKILATGATPQEPARFIHSARWPNKGTDRFALIGGETNFQPQCGPTNGAFMTFDASSVAQDGTFRLIDEIRPINGAYLDSNPPAQVLGCSVHWFEEHPTFRDGGLVALAEYENGTRFLQIQPDGKIKEQGFFIPLGGSTSAPHWVPGTDIVYAIDYERGIDVLRYKGSHYVPESPGGPVKPEPGTVPGTEGRQPAPPARDSGAVCASDAGFERIGVRPGERLRFDVVRREKRPFNVSVFQQSHGRRIVGERRVAHFTGRSKSFAWDAGERLADGYYFARFTMALPGGRKDVRRFTLVRRHGRFHKAAAFYARASCGALRAFKLRRPVFGGPDRRSLGIAYRLNSGVDSVSVVALRGRKVIKRFGAGNTAAAKTIRLRLSARGIPRGAKVKIRIRLQRANARVTETLVARRL